MSRSRKKTPVVTWGSKSKKEDRQYANRIFRRKEKQAIHNEDFDDTPLVVREVSDIWDWACDGWNYMISLLNGDYPWYRK